ncbi:MAG: sigma-70 family RNA polymerase sigma factor [Oscillospiraceae bacterium]|nr:sigma-70 family RNA polymerase sigma factor [Oscillospiraceae bacterium]
MLQSRDEQGLREIKTKYGDLCLYVARNILGDEADAEECLNDALLNLWNAIPPAQPSNLRAYVMKLTRNIALNRRKTAKAARRSGGQFSQTLDELAELFPAENDTAAELEQRELLAAVTAFLSKLPAKQRDLFVRRYWGAVSTADLANDFHMSEGNVKVTLSRIRQRLREQLEKEGLL